MKITILVAAYNTEKYIGKCLTSLINQTHRDIEIICINDGSTDNTSKIIEEFATQDNRIKLINVQHIGIPSKVRNEGLCHSTGEYICLVDSDDWLNPDALELVIQKFDENEVDIVLFDIVFFDQEKEIYNNNKFLPFKSLTGLDALELSLDWKIPGLAIWKAQELKKYKFNENGINGDEFTARQLLMNARIVVNSNAKYYYRMHPNSITKKISIKHFQSIRTKYDLIKLFRDNNIPRRIINKSILRFYTNLSDDVIKFYKQKKEFTIAEKKIIISDLKKYFKLIDYDMSQYILSLSQNYLVLLLKKISLSNFNTFYLGTLFKFFITKWH